MLDVKKVGMKISLLRKGFGCSQEKLAELLNVTPQAVSKWENGHALPDTSLLPVLAQIFECTVDAIIMPAYSFDEKVEREKPNVLEQQAEHIAKYVYAKLEDKQAEKEQVGFSDDTITEAVMNRHRKIKSIIINRGKTSRTMGDIRTPITVSTPQGELNLLETIYHKRQNRFNGYTLLNDYVKEIPAIYHIDREKKAILSEDLGDSYIAGYCFNDNDEDGNIYRANYQPILRAAANWHGALWENHKAFERAGLPWHFETKENMLAWINNAMERPYRKYRKNEEDGKIPKKGALGGANVITQKEFDLYEEALKYLKAEYIKLVDERFNAGKNITVIHGDMHPGRTRLSKSPDRRVVFVDPQAFRIGLCTEDLAMLIALHMSCDSDAPEARVFNDTRPLLDHYYQCLSEKVKDYPYETFMSDYKLSVAENLFFPIRLINNIAQDFRMRDRAIHAFEVFVMGRGEY